MAARAPVALRWEGLDELQAALKHARGKTDKKAVREAGKLIVKTEIVPPVRSGAPQRSGRLARSVRAAFSTTRTQLVVGSQVRVPYAGPINFGWAARGISGQEFIYSGIDRSLTAVEEDYVKWLDDAAREVAPLGRL